MLAVRRDQLGAALLAAIAVIRISSSLELGSA